MKKCFFSIVAAAVAVIMSTTVAFACIDWPPQNFNLTGTVGTSFSHRLRADSSCDDGLSSWRLGPGNIPPGLSFSAGLISGTPTEAGTFVFNVVATDGCGDFQSPPITITVSPGAAPEPAPLPTPTPPPAPRQTPAPAPGQSPPPAPGQTPTPGQVPNPNASQPAAAPAVLLYFEEIGGPTAPVANRTFIGERTVFLGTETAGADIRYTLDGTAPTSSSRLYNATTGIHLTQTTTIRAIAVHSNYLYSPELTTRWHGTDSTGVTFTRIAPGEGEIKFVSDLRPTLTNDLWTAAWPAAKHQLAWIGHGAGNTESNFASNGTDSGNWRTPGATGYFTYEFENFDGSIQGRVQGNQGTITIFQRNGNNFTPVTSGATFDFADQFTRYFATMTEYQHDHPRTITPWGIAIERFPIVSRQYIADGPWSPRPANTPPWAERYPERCIYFVYSSNTPTGYVTAMFTRINECTDLPGGNVSRESLATAIANANERREGDYTPGSWSRMQTAFNRAVSAYQNANATQDEVNAAYTALAQRVNALIERPAMSALNAALTAARQLTVTDFVSANDFARLQAAISNAQSVSRNPNSSQSNVDATLSRLQRRINAASQ